jgi:protease-4
MNMTFWKTFWASLLASIAGGIIVVVVFFAILSAMISGLSSQFETKEISVTENTVLHMELNGMVGDYTYADLDPMTFQMTKQFGLNDILDGLELAKNDDRIKGVFLNCYGVNAGFATIKEIRDALIDFKSSGKFVVAYNENYSKSGYYLATAADELYTFPSGMVEFLGLGAELVFLKGALEKLDVEMQVIRGSNNKFKSAVEPLLYDQMSEANRKQTMKYLTALWSEITTAVGESRNKKVSYLNQVADSVWVRDGRDAVEYGLVDGAFYYDSIYQRLVTLTGVEEEADMTLLSFQKYALKKNKEERQLNILEKKNIAVVFAEGEIVDGSGSPNQIGGESLSAELREVRKDEDIKAVVLRVNSPGGSALASDIIWREVDLLSKAGKKVVVSMGDYAASGGYYISCAADRIFAQPNTLTGSIGVFGIIPYTGDMFKNKLGITFDRVQTNEHSVLSLNKKLTEEELKIIQEGVDDIYDDFLSRVSEGRGMTKADVDSIGQGRVWAGTDALKIGLVDELGGLKDAIAYAAESAGIASDSISVSYLPKQKNQELFEFLESIEQGQAQMISPKSDLEAQLMEIYGFAKTIGSRNQYQARLPYLMWVR